MDTRLTPMDIQEVKFGVSFRGYHRREVDTFLDKIASALERERTGSASLREKAANLEVQLLELRKKEGALNNTLVAAQQVVEEMRRNAQKEVDLRVREAEMNAEQLTKDAWDQLRRIKQEIDEARKEKVLFLDKWRAALKTMERALLMASEDDPASAGTSTRSSERNDRASSPAASERVRFSNTP